MWNFSIVFIILPLVVMCRGPWWCSWGLWSGGGQVGIVYTLTCCRHVCNHRNVCEIQRQTALPSVRCMLCYSWDPLTVETCCLNVTIKIYGNIYSELSIFRFWSERRKWTKNVRKWKTTFLMKKVVHCHLLHGRILPQLKIWLFKT
jgi:hypothetical protein